MCIHSLQMEKAVEILDEMFLAGITPNERTYTNIMHGYASLGDTGKAFEYFTKMRREGMELDVYTYEALLKACCKSGRMQSALAVTREMNSKNIPRNTFVYNILIDGYELYNILAVLIHMNINEKCIFCYFQSGIDLVILLSVWLCTCILLNPCVLKYSYAYYYYMCANFNLM